MFLSKEPMKSSVANCLVSTFWSFSWILVSSFVLSTVDSFSTVCLVLMNSVLNSDILVLIVTSSLFTSVQGSFNSSVVFLLCCTWTFKQLISLESFMFWVSRCLLEDASTFPSLHPSLKMEASKLSSGLLGWQVFHGVVSSGLLER